MPKEVKFARHFLSYLVKCRKIMVEKKASLGELGLLLEDKEGVISGCVFPPRPRQAEFSKGCAASPSISKTSLNKAVLKAYKEGMKPVGVLLLNPDEGEVDSGGRKNFVGGGDSPEYPRAYSLYRMKALIDSFLLPIEVIIIDAENSPMRISLASEEEREEKTLKYKDAVYPIAKIAVGKDCERLKLSLGKKNKQKITLINMHNKFSPYIKAVTGGRIGKGVIVLDEQTPD